jgi:DNA-binding transcriptional regulator PaaX
LVPESKRDLRHRLRTRLSWAGFGSPEAGVWISPHLGREDEALHVVKELDLAASAMSFTAAFGRIGGQDEMVRRAWDLTALEERYEAFLAGFGELEPAGRAEALHAQTRLVHEWRRFPFLDPRLPVSGQRWGGGGRGGGPRPPPPLAGLRYFAPCAAGGQAAVRPAVWAGVRARAARRARASAKAVRVRR